MQAHSIRQDDPFGGSRREGGVLYPYSIHPPSITPVRGPSMLSLCCNPKKCCLLSEGFGINHYSLFGGFPDGAGFPLQSFLRQKRISAPIPNPLRLRGLRE